MLQSNANRGEYNLVKIQIESSHSAQVCSMAPSLLRFKTQGRPGMVVHTCNSSTQEVNTGESQVQIQPRLQNEFKASLDYTVRPCLNLSINKIKFKN
jgi:hypothetical protein